MALFRCRVRDNLRLPGLANFIPTLARHWRKHVDRELHMNGTHLLRRECLSLIIWMGMVPLDTSLVSYYDRGYLTVICGV